MLSIAKGGMTDGCPKEYYCLSTDTKPTPTEEVPIPNGSFLLEMDTGSAFFFDNENKEWIEQ